MSELAAALEQAAVRVEESLRELLRSQPEQSSARFATDVLLAAAAMTTAAHRLDRSAAEARLSLHIVSTLARDAAGAARADGAEEIAADLESVAWRCERVLAPGTA